MRSSVIGASIAFALSGGATTALAQIVVTPSSLNGWDTIVFDDGASPTPHTSGSATFVNGVGSPPLGTGSLELSTGQYGDGAARGYTRNFDGQSLANITSLTYSCYAQAASYAGLHIYLSLRVDYDNDGAEDDIIFFEPEYQRAGYNNNSIPDQPDGVIGQWQSWDAFVGGWWSNNNILGTGLAGADCRPFSDFVNAYPNAVIAGDQAPGLRLTAGFGAGTWDNFVGNVDAFHIGTSDNGSFTYDFELTPTPGAAAALGLGGLMALRRRRA